MDALWFGCIPVLITSYYVPPIPELIEWENIAVVVSEAQVCVRRGRGACVCVYVHACTCVCMYVHVYIRTYMCIHV